MIQERKTKKNGKEKKKKTLLEKMHCDFIYIILKSRRWTKISYYYEKERNNKPLHK
jgi:hypothetical protein